MLKMYIFYGSTMIFYVFSGPRWASWNLGIFLCIRCAGIHRNLGVHISKVKSVNLDTWTSEQIAVSLMLYHLYNKCKTLIVHDRDALITCEACLITIFPARNNIDLTSGMTIVIIYIIVNLWLFLHKIYQKHFHLHMEARKQWPLCS